MRHIKMVIIADGTTSAEMRIQDMGTRSDDSEVKDFEVVLAINRGAGIYGRHTRVLDGFPANALNTVALIKAALNLFSADSLVAEDDDNPTETSSSDLERRLGRTMRSIPTQEESRLRNH
jgi:hypothetical protein